MPEFTFTLSLAAVDLLWEQLRLGSPVRIFEVPSVGETEQARDRLRQIVFDDLTQRNLAYRGRLEPEVEEALVTLGRFQLAIDVVGMLDRSERLLARVAGNGRSAVVARLRDQTVTFDVVRPEAVLAETVRLIGDEKPGPGRSVTYPEEDQATPARHRAPEAEEGFSGVFEQQRATGGYEAERRAARVMWDKPRKRIGMFTVYGRDRLGREIVAPVLSWFDTDEGRYFGQVRPGSDGRQWTMYSPADAARIRQQLDGMIRSVSQTPPPAAARR